MAGRTIRRVGACRSLVDNKEQPIADYTILPHERRESTQRLRKWGECVLAVFKAEDVLGEGKRRVTITSARPRNNWGFETHHRSLLSDCQLVCPTMAAFSRSNALRNALRSSVVAGSRRGVTNKAYPDHTPLSIFEHAFLTVGTGLAALLDPRRGGECDKLKSALNGPHVL